MFPPFVVIRDDASLIEEHLTNAIAFVMAKYRAPRGFAAECPYAGRIGALLNVLAYEIATLPCDQRSDRMIGDLEDELRWRVAESLSLELWDPVD